MEHNERFAAIKQKFLSRLADWSPVYEQFIDGLTKGHVDTADTADVQMRVHKIAGSAKTFGFAELSTAAAAAELEFDRAKAGQTTLVSDSARKSLHTLHLQMQNALAERTADAEVFSQEIPNRLNNRHTILVADDDDLVRELLVNEFIRTSCHIMQANDGSVVLEIIKSCAMHADAEKPDLILLDVNMPKVNGLEVLKKLKATPATQNIPVVMLTRRDEDESIIEAISLGAADYITKPFELADLISRITDQLVRRKNKILIADDDELIRELLSHRFHRNGISVITAKSGPEALQRIKSEHPDVVVLDIMMPGMSGINVLKQMKVEEALKKIPVILLTAKSQQENILLGLESGAHDYITKPFDTDEVVARVNGIMQRSQSA